MAYGKKYYTSFKSYNGWDYYMEIWEKDFVGSDSEIILGAGGPIISYDTDSENRDNTILASTLSIPFIVENGTQETFIDNLRDLYEEQDIYVHLYQSTSANEDPLWSGFLLMDLGTKEDVIYPFEVKLTATDGISLLKDRDFVIDGATRPYGSSDVFWGPANFTYWIARILEKVGAGSTGNGAYSNANFSTSVNWYNQEHDSNGQADDPLRLTQGKISWTHSIDDNGNYSVLNCYDVLKEIMKVWHCRITYWNHSFFIVQIPEYNTLETGTNLNPINVNTRIYTISGGASSNQAYLGNKYKARYLLLFGQNIQGGIQKLVGTKYQFYPRLKSTSAGYITGGGTNYYNGFPTYNGTVLISPQLQQTIIDAASATNIFLAIPLNVSQTGTGDISVRMFFQVKATNGTTTRWLKFQNNTYSWNATQPATSPTFYGPKWKGTISGSNPQVVLGFSEILPTDPLFTGAWDFEIQMDDSQWGNSSIYSFWAAPLGQTPVTWYSTPTSLGITWTNLPNLLIVGGVGSLNASSSSPFDGQLLLLNSSAGVNISGQNVIIETSYTDSDNFDFGELRWGDSQSATDPGNLTVWDGAAWVQTDFSGEWGEGTLLGVVNFTNLMLTEFMSGQATNIQIINARLMTSKVGKDSDDGTLTVPNYVNPIGILRESVPGADNTYVFRRGAFQLTTDEWDYEGWVIKDRTETTTITTTNTWGPNGPVSDDNGTMGFMIGNPNTGSNAAATNAFITRTSDDITGTLTRIEIVAIDIELLKTGDKVLLIDKFNRMYALEINATQSSGDEYLTIVSYDFGDDIIPIGALLTHNEVNLIEQYQRKSEGTVAGFDVDATTLTKGGIGIDGFLDSDTMTGASATTLPTSESVKAYVDSSVGASDTLQEVTDNGNTTTNDIMLEGANTTNTVLGMLKIASTSYPDAYGAVIGKTNSGGINQVDLIFNTAYGTSSEKMRILAQTGNVGIGTSIPLALLDVNGNIYSSGNVVVDLIYSRSGSSDLNLAARSGYGVNIQQLSGNSIAYFDYDTTNVGIGTTSPDAQLEISNSESGSGIGGATLRLTRDETTSVAGDPIGTITFYSTDADGPHITAYIKSMSEETYGRKGSLSFGTSQTNNTDAVEVMRITDAGNVGIGTTSPGEKLEVYGNIKVRDNDRIYLGNSGDLALIHTGSYGEITNYTGDLIIRNTAANEDIIFKAESGTGTDVEIMRIDGSSGNVGIGTTSPGQKLEINGKILLQNNDEIRFKDTGGTERTAIELDGSNDLNIGTSAGGNLKFINGSSYTERMRITSAGNVGIGTTSPDDKLHVSGGNIRLTANSSTAAILSLHPNNGNSVDKWQIAADADGSNLSFSNKSTGSMVSTMYLKDDGNVGIGTTAPEAKLHIGVVTLGISPDTDADIISSGGVLIKGGKMLSFDDNYSVHANMKYNASGAEARFELHGYYGFNFITRSTTSSMVIKGDTGNVGIGTTAPSAKLEIFEGYLKIGDDSNTGYGITLERNSANVGNINTANNRINIQAQNSRDVELRDTSGNGLILKDGGNVGIGTTAPASILHVYENSSGAGTGIGLTIENDGAGDAIAQFLLTGSKRWVMGIDNSDSNKFKIADSSDLDTDALLTIDGDGNVGIGTTSPTTKLEVVGTGKFSDQVTIPATPVASTDAASKGYVDLNSGGVTNYEQFKCSGTSTTSATDGEGSAVVIKYDTSIIASSTNTIIAVGSGGAGGSEGSEYCFYSTTQGQFELQWNLGTNTNIVNNRLLTGVKLQTGTIVEEVMVWVDVDTTHSYIYNRGSGSVRQGSTTNQTIVESKITLVQQYWRVVFWKEESTDASTTAISLLNASSIIIKQLS